MRPVSEPDGHDLPGLLDKFVPGVDAVVEDVVIVAENSVREPIVAHELPEIFDRVQFGAFGGQIQQGDIVRDIQGVGAVPAGLIKQQHRVRAWGDL